MLPARASTLASDSAQARDQHAVSVPAELGPPRTLPRECELARCVGEARRRQARGTVTEEAVLEDVEEEEELPRPVP